MPTILLRRIFLLCQLLALTPVGARETLHLHTWADYISPDVVSRFEQDNDCKVVIDTFDSNESLYARIKAGAAGYDVLVPTNYMVQIMAQEGLLDELDRQALPNTRHLDPEVLASVWDRAGRWSVPYTVGYAVIAYRKDRVKDPEPTWRMFERPDLRGRITLLDDMRETLGAALKTLGHSINTRDESQLAAAAEVARRWRPNAARLDNEAYKAGLDSGEFLLAHGYSGDLYQLVQENPKIGILIPREGVTIGCDMMVIPKTAPSKALAHRFINFLLDPEVAAENMQWMGYPCPNSAAMKLVDPEFLAHPAVTLPPEIRAQAEAIEDLGDDLVKWTRAWDRVKE